VLEHGWASRAGHGRTLALGTALTLTSAAPWVWFVWHREFRSSRFLWSIVLMVLGVAVPMIWNAARMRCLVCKVPIYAFWLIGFPRDSSRRRFEQIDSCPYCGDDGTGLRGEGKRVDRSLEVRAAGKYLLTSLAMILVPFGLFMLLYITDRIPGLDK